MSDKTIKLTRRRAIGGLITIGGAAAAAGAGTFALFSDSETSSGNQITAGTLNLELDPDSDASSTSISISDLKPTDSGYLAIELGNIGNVDANLTGVNLGDVDSSGAFTAALVSDTEGTDSEFESSPGTDGELDDYLEVGLMIEPGGDFTGTEGVSEGSQWPRDGTETNVLSDGTVLATAVGEHSPDSTETLNQGETKFLVLNYNLPDGGESDNVFQGDGVEFDLQVELEQA